VIVVVKVCVKVEVVALQGVVGGILEKVDVVALHVVTDVADVVEAEIVVVEVILAVGGTVPSDGDASQVCTCKP
jgi:hypothetical protein